MALKLTKAVCAQIAHLVSYGYTQRTIAQMVNISEEQLCRAKKYNPDVAHAFTVGKSITVLDMKANIHKLAMTSESDVVKLNASTKAIELATDGAETTDTTKSDAQLRLDIIKDLA